MLSLTQFIAKQNLTTRVLSVRVFAFAIALSIATILSSSAASSHFLYAEEPDNEGVQIAKVESREIESRGVKAGASLRKGPVAKSIASKAVAESRHAPLLLLARDPLAHDSAGNSAKAFQSRSSSQSVHAFKLPSTGQSHNESETRCLEHNDSCSIVRNQQLESFLEASYQDRIYRSTQEGALSYYEQDHLRLAKAPRDPRFIALQKLARKMATRQMRRFFRSQLKDRYQEDPTFHYFDYLARKEVVSQFGRSEEERIVALEEAREDVLDGDHEADEEDLAVLGWGPFRITDSGRVGIDVKRINRSVVSKKIEIAPEHDGASEALPGRSLFEGQSYRFDSDFKVRPRVGSLLSGGGLGEIGAKLSVELLTPILKERYLAAEIETSVDAEGEAAFFFTIRVFGN